MRSLSWASVSVAWIAALGAVAGIGGTLTAVMPAQAQECPGNPDALGTSRVLTLEPALLPQVGVMQYRQTLPLADKEVVLTFDDGPLPRYSNPILDILAAQCVQATYFLVGHMARSYPAVVRRMYEAGHSIGTHSENHPTRFQKLPIEKMRHEIDEGIADVVAALGDPKELAPFFRIPGLARSDTVEEELAARSLVVFSSDTVADDWHRRIGPGEIVSRAMRRLEARGKGILLLHDIHPATVAALPELLKKLKEAGFRVVHVVPAAADRIESAGGHSLDNRGAPDWPKSVALPAADLIALPVPDEKFFATDYRPWQIVVLADDSASAGYLALASIAQWSDPPWAAILSSDDTELPAPALEDVGSALAEWGGVDEVLAAEPSFSLTDVAKSVTDAGNSLTDVAKTVTDTGKPESAPPDAPAPN